MIPQALRGVQPSELKALVHRACAEIVEQYEDTAQTVGTMRLDDHRGEWQFEPKSGSVRLTLDLEDCEAFQPSLDALNYVHGRCLWFTSLSPSRVAVRVKAECLQRLASETPAPFTDEENTNDA